MKVPKYIKQKMHECVRFRSMSIAAMEVVEGWLERNGIDPEEVRDGSGCSLEELEYGNDVVDELCERLEEEYG